MRKKVLLILLLILLLASALRFFRYDFADVITDEVFYGYRSIGLIDSLNSPFQPTPFEWYEDPPGWAKLSFHDHPPLGFWIQHLSFLVFGNNLLGLRFPFIIAGIITVLFTYLVAKRLFNREAIALLSAGILAVNNYHVWVSRTGVQEGLVIFFQLVAIWLFLKTLRNEKWFYPTVVAVGLAVLMKYTSIVLLPIFLIYSFWKRRDVLSPTRLIGGGVLLLVILSPVIIYNLKLYQTRGHFDYQISYFLKQDVPEWEIRPGRELAGGFIEKFTHLLYRFHAGYGIVFTIGTIVSLLYLYKSAHRHGEGWQFLSLALGFSVLLLFVVGIEERFLPMLAPYLAIMIAGTFFLLLQRRRILIGSIAVFVLLELAYTVNSYFTLEPRGREVYTYSKLRRDSNAWGYNQLAKYLQELMKGYYPAYNFPLRFAFAQNLQKQARERDKAAGLTPRAIMFVSDSNIYGVASLWYITRRTVYDGWPIITDSTFWQAVREDPEHFSKQGMKEIYFIRAADTLLRLEEHSSQGEELEKTLLGQDKRPILIRNPAEKVAFRIYQF